MSLAARWQEIQASLPASWGDANLRLTLADEAGAETAAALLGPLTPGRRGTQIRFFATRDGAGPGAEAVLRALRRLDDERIAGHLELVSSDEASADAVVDRATLAESWDAGLGALPTDWSDLYAELELTSTDHLERAALLMSPLNPSLLGRKPALRFRVARAFGYGAAPGLTRRCLERLDEEGIRAEVRVLRALSDTHPVGTQGPVWRVEGRAV